MENILYGKLEYFRKTVYNLISIRIRIVVVLLYENSINIFIFFINLNIGCSIAFLKDKPIYSRNLIFAYTTI